MSRCWIMAGLSALIASSSALAQGDRPIRVAVLDFQDLTGLPSDARLGGGIERVALAEKGPFFIAKALANRPAFTLVDRRDLINQLEGLRPKDESAPTPTRPTFLHAAQAVRADVVLRGSLLAFSPGKQVIRQGGIQTELATLTVRAGVEAIDAVDGSVIAASDGVSRRQIRQTESVQTFFSEDEVLQMIEEALVAAIPSLEKALTARAEAVRQRPKARLSVRTEADPALVELDGILMGSTPLEGLVVYQGDHVLTISKPGYRQITKRILIESDTTISTPMLREELTADELKEIFDKMQLNLIRVEPGLLIQPAPAIQVAP